MNPFSSEHANILSKMLTSFTQSSIRQSVELLGRDVNFLNSQITLPVEEPCFCSSPKRYFIISGVVDLSLIKANRRGFISHYLLQFSLSDQWGFVFNPPQSALGI
ncbi:hypothetical protein K1719_010242 [Acacia pycnantha]|nr:hypothetical protein K1719_010242 [Acacia pycnantha]